MKLREIGFEVAVIKQLLKRVLQKKITGWNQYGPGRRIWPAQLGIPVGAGEKKLADNGGPLASSLNARRGIVLLLPGRYWDGTRASSGSRAATGRLTGAAATGGEDAGRMQGLSSTTSSRYSTGGSSATPGTCGGLRGRRGRRARLRARERGKRCLGGSW
jgi:hypothetical protein